VLSELVAQPERLAITAHDAGAANLILAWIAAESGPYRLQLGGPAEHLWRQRFGAKPRNLPSDRLLQGADCLLSGTGWASDQEHEARKISKATGIRSVAVIDHWVNYRERFIRNGDEVLPDEIWVSDEYALDMALAEFPEVPVRLKPNLYLDEQLANAPALTDPDRDVLIVAEPARSDWGRGTPGEFQALDYFLLRREAAGIPDDAPIRIRAHPSDPEGKYDGYVRPGVSIDRSHDIASALAGVRWVIGCQSYALVIALAAGRQVISALPPWAPPCLLPQPGIVHLAKL
jgi:hypothetical protein